MAPTASTKRRSTARSTTPAAHGCDGDLREGRAGRTRAARRRGRGVRSRAGRARRPDADVLRQRAHEFRRAALPRALPRDGARARRRARAPASRSIPSNIPSRASSSRSRRTWTPTTAIASPSCASARGSSSAAARPLHVRTGKTIRLANSTLLMGKDRGRGRRGVRRRRRRPVRSGHLPHRRHAVRRARDSLTRASRSSRPRPSCASRSRASRSARRSRRASSSSSRRASSSSSASRRAGRQPGSSAPWGRCSST